MTPKTDVLGGRGLAAFAAAALLLLATSCSTTSSAATSDSPTTSTGLGSPIPVLPTDIDPILYSIGDLVALGNVQLLVEDVSVRAPPTRDPATRLVQIRVRIENGALVPLQIDPTSLRLYTASGASVTPSAGSVQELGRTPLASTEQRAFDVEYEVADDDPAVMLVFDGAGYGDRVKSGAILVEVPS